MSCYRKSVCQGKPTFYSNRVIVECEKEERESWLVAERWTQKDGSRKIDQKGGHAAGEREFERARRMNTLMDQVDSRGTLTLECGEMCKKMD